MKATDSDFFSPNCVNVDCSNLHKIHYLVNHRNMFFYRRTKDKLGPCKKETTFKVNKTASSKPTEPPNFRVPFTIIWFRINFIQLVQFRTCVCLLLQYQIERIGVVHWVFFCHLNLLLDGFKPANLSHMNYLVWIYENLTSSAFALEC